MGTKKEFIGKINCEGCPCLNIDGERGADCNLGYGTLLINVSDDPLETILMDISVDCGLGIVKHSNGEFRPTKIRGNG